MEGGGTQHEECQVVGARRGLVRVRIRVRTRVRVRVRPGCRCAAQPGVEGDVGRCGGDLERCREI